jgi:hypothetical protein
MGEYSYTYLMEPKPTKDVIVKTFDTVTIKAIDWLWPGRIPQACVSLLAGEPEVGKSTLAIYMAAQVSTGRPWIDTGKCQKKGSVLILSTEDINSQVIAPRLRAAGANMKKIHFIDSVVDGDKRYNLSNLTEDFKLLVMAVMRIPDIRLIIIDPITGFMHGKNENKNAEIREYLNPLGGLAQASNCSILGISHFNKNQMTQSAMNRVLGSIGFVAAVRAVHIVAKDPNDDELRLFLPLKCNLSKHAPGLAYKLIQTQVPAENDRVSSVSYCAFTMDEVKITAAEILAPTVAVKRKQPVEKSELEEWLLEFLKDGPKKTSDIMNVGLQLGFSERSIQRMKNKLAVQSVKHLNDDGSGYWEWSLPT